MFWGRTECPDIKESLMVNKVEIDTPKLVRNYTISAKEAENIQLDDMKTPISSEIIP